MPPLLSIAPLLAILLPLLATPAPVHAEPRQTRITGGLVLHPDGRIVRLPSGQGAGGVLPRGR